MQPAQDSILRTFQPVEIDDIRQTGLAKGLLVDLILKYAYFEGSINQNELEQRSKLHRSIIQAIYHQIHEDRLCESKPYENRIALNEKGRSLAEVALRKSQYIGPAPVTLADYDRAASAQGLRPALTLDRLRSALDDLVLPDSVLTEIGGALFNGGTLLLYGSTGNGKTSVAERLPRLFDDLVYIPWAIEVSGQIVTVFDPLVHDPETSATPVADPRWLLCRRPMVKVGGEMQADMLDTRVDEVGRVCTAPVQMKANNGILLIDDFGRQRITPRELLNRWIVPLDRGRDILSLPSGARFEIPFKLLVVFATNLSLTDLAEDAFLRRLKNKVRIETLPEDLFTILVTRVCAELHLKSDVESSRYFAEECLRHSPAGLRACFPSDLINIVRGLAAFEGRPPSLNKQSIDQAINIYFAR